jgi:hypothetical protein
MAGDAGMPSFSRFFLPALLCISALFHGWFHSFYFFVSLSLSVMNYFFAFGSLLSCLFLFHLFVSFLYPCSHWLGVAGPTSAHTRTVMTEDTGKYLGAAENSGQYRMAGDAGVAGPTSAHTRTVVTEDTGKYLGAAENSGQYRQVGDAGVAGPTSAHSTTVMTEDSGKYVGTGDY